MFKIKGSVIYTNQQQKALDDLLIILKTRGWSMVGEYVNTYSKIMFKCDNGHEVCTRPNYIKKGGGCSICNGINSDHAKEKFESLVESCDYLVLGKYSNNATKVEIRCSEGHVYKTSPANFTLGKRCPSCCTTGFDPTLPAILYYLRVCDGIAYKIGITNRTVAKRFRASDLEKIDVLKIVKYENGYDARSEETRILREFNYAQYDGVSLLTSGNTELFDRDVLGVDDGVITL